jgi:Tfp pilus assembly protein PilX
MLEPPNGKLVPVTVSGMMTEEPGGSRINASSATYVVTDEYGIVQPSGSVDLGLNGNYAFIISLQASRNGEDKDGRHYTITVNVRDNAGNVGVASTIVRVPHDQRK